MNDEQEETMREREKMNDIADVVRKRKEIDGKKL
jgi:hypothetical protein